MCGSELWGLDCIRYQRTVTANSLTVLKKLSCEELNLSFCRSIVGVHRKAQSSAVRGELERMHLSLDSVANIINYQNNFESKPQTHFQVKSALQTAL